MNDAVRASGDSVSNNLNIPYFSQALDDAETLLAYAAESGLDVDGKVSEQILAARTACQTTGVNEQVAGGLLRALTVLSAKLKPITAASLRLSAEHGHGARSTLRVYRAVAISLALFLMPFSLATFVGSSISAAIHEQIVAANALAVTLSNELPPNPTASPTDATAPSFASARKGAADALQRGISQAEVIRQLQEFAADTRSIYARAKQLNALVLGRISDPYAHAQVDEQNRKPALELPPGLPDLTEAATHAILVYQGIRYFAQTTQDSVATFYGAFAACVLPALYALLGACAQLLRMFEQQLRARTLTKAALTKTTYAAHFVIAGISGGVIGLFTNLNFGQGASLSPLAVAFLVGYGVDVFFAFLDGIIQPFLRQHSPKSPRDTVQEPS
jgi:hypothetical protein